jgi:hypothetical protein
MRKIAWIFILLAGTANAANAQSTSTVTPPEPPRWDVNLNAGLFGHRPGNFDDRYNNWYSEGRYATSIGYYWTEHLKTELEFAHSGEGERYVQDVVRVPGTGALHSVAVEAFNRLQQTSLRMVWQFGSNTWVHPYVNAGYVLDADRQRRRSPVTYSYPGDPRAVPPILVRPEINSGPDIEYRSGVSVGVGSKFYVAPAAYINTGVQWTYTRPAKTITFLSGFGMEF